MAPLLCAGNFLKPQAWFVHYFPFQILNLEIIFMNLDENSGLRVAGGRKLVINSSGVLETCGRSLGGVRRPAPNVWKMKDRGWKMAGMT